MIRLPLKSLPCCYFPTKTVLIDDDAVFMDTLSCGLVNNQRFNHPEHALEILLKYQPQVSENLLLEMNVEADHTDRINKQSLIINFSKMKDIFSNIQREEDISVVIVDYKMPGIDGISVLQKLKDKPFKKILLTGNSDEVLAVEAFNDGLIDYFLPKTEKKLSDKLKGIIEDLKVDYFFNLTKRLYDYSPDLITLSKNQGFKDFFMQNLCDLKISEFYLNDLIGTYVLLNNDKKKYYLVVYSHKQLLDLADVAEKDGASRELVNEMRKHIKIPFFGQNKNFWEVPGNKWHSYLYPATVIDSNTDNFYGSIVEAS